MDQLKITDPARALLWSMWMSPKFTLRFGMKESKPSPEAEAALNSLVDGGILIEFREDCGAVTYSLSSDGEKMDRRPPGNGSAEMMQFINEHGSFPMTVPIAG